MRYFISRTKELKELKELKGLRYHRDGRGFKSGSRNFNRIAWLIIRRLTIRSIILRPPVPFSSSFLKDVRDKVIIDRAVYECLMRVTSRVHSRVVHNNYPVESRISSCTTS
jgi:hypothetical protein